MSNEEYIQQNPHWFKDELDKWLFREFNIIGGACSSQESFRYSVAREVAEKAMEYAREQMMKDAEELLVGIDANGLACVNVEGVLPDEKIKVLIIPSK